MSRRAYGKTVKFCYSHEKVINCLKTAQNYIMNTFVVHNSLKGHSHYMSKAGCRTALLKNTDLYWSCNETFILRFSSSSLPKRRSDPVYDEVCSPPRHLDDHRTSLRQRLSDPIYDVPVSHRGTVHNGTNNPEF